VTVLLQAAATHRAQIVGAPFLLVLEGEDALPGAIADARAYAVDSIGLDQVETFPTRVLRTPFIPAPALVHRSVVDAGIRFDEGYRGNAYREDTAFFCEGGPARLHLDPDPADGQLPDQRLARRGAHDPPTSATSCGRSGTPGASWSGTGSGCTGRACRPTRFPWECSSRSGACGGRLQPERSLPASGLPSGTGDDRRADAGARSTSPQLSHTCELVRSKQQRSSHRGAITDGMP
jgi:hypothetical protein